MVDRWRGRLRTVDMDGENALQQKPDRHDDRRGGPRYEKSRCAIRQ